MKFAQRQQSGMPVTSTCWSLNSLELEFLFVFQRYHWIDSRTAVCRNEIGPHRDQGQEGGHKGESIGVPCRNFKKIALEQAG